MALERDRAAAEAAAMSPTGTAGMAASSVGIGIGIGDSRRRSALRRGASLVEPASPMAARGGEMRFYAVAPSSYRKRSVGGGFSVVFRVIF